MTTSFKQYVRFVAISAWVALTGCEAANTEYESSAPQPSSNRLIETEKRKLSGEQLFAVCQACHNISKGEPHKVGPNLYGLMGQPAASREGYVYSAALTDSGIVWSKGLLLGWVLSAENMVPKTWMVYHNHLSVENTEKLVDYVIAKTSE